MCFLNFSRSYAFPESLIIDSRNLVKVYDNIHRSRMLKQGKINIVSALCDLPKTTHEANSFVIDVPAVISNNFIQIVINGVYREHIKKNSLLRAFSRSFIIIPQGEGYVIMNDLLLLINATVEQIQKYRVNKSFDTSFGSPGFSASSASVVDVMPNEKEVIISNFMAATGMNRASAIQCLEENKYDQKAAMNVFQCLKEKNLIPPEFFT